jgi:hypothetical protein
MENFLLLPPVAFIVYLVISSAISGIAKPFGAKGKASEGKEKSYACGQVTEMNKVQPDYREFFPFVFFFTIMHVVVLIIAMMNTTAMWLAIAYIAVALLALRILFRR